MSRTVEQIWYKDPVAYILDTKSLLYFIPNPKSSLEAQLNDAVRFSVYFGVLVAVLRKDARALFFPVFVAFFTIFIYSYEEKKRAAEKKVMEKLNIDVNERTNVKCTKPTPNNPFMNVLMSDYQDFPNKPAACSITNKKVQELVDSYANGDAPTNSDDIFNRQPLDIQFYSMPSTTIPNQQTDFANWCYNPGKTSKEQAVTNLNWR